MVLWYGACSLIGNPREGPQSFASGPLPEEPLWSLRSLFQGLELSYHFYSPFAVHAQTHQHPHRIYHGPIACVPILFQPTWHVNFSSLRKMKERQGKWTYPALVVYFLLHQRPSAVLCDHQERPFFCWRFSGTPWMGQCGALSEPWLL